MTLRNAPALALVTRRHQGLPHNGTLRCRLGFSLLDRPAFVHGDLCAAILEDPRIGTENDSRPPSKLLLRRWFCLPGSHRCRSGTWQLNGDRFWCFRRAWAWCRQHLQLQPRLHRLGRKHLRRFIHSQLLPQQRLVMSKAYIGCGWRGDAIQTLRAVLWDFCLGKGL